MESDKVNTIPLNSHILIMIGKSSICLDIYLI